MLTRKYLNENRLLTVPFEKGIGFSVMKIEKYQEKLDAILNLTKFDEVPIKKREKEPRKRWRAYGLNACKVRQQLPDCERSWQRRGSRRRGWQPST